MAEPGENLSRRYRELAREEPSAALDEAILAASRRAVSPRSHMRWATPVSIAAVLVLGIGVALRMQVEQPGVETSVASGSPPNEYSVPQAAEAPPAREEKAAAPAAEPAKPAPAPRAKRLEAPVPAPVLADKPAAAPAPQFVPAPPSAPAPASPPAAEMRAAPLAKREAFAADSMQRRDAQEKPRDEREAELERIAKLRAGGRHDEADKALEEFRRRHPDYRIAPAMWERVKPRP